MMLDQFKHIWLKHILFAKVKLNFNAWFSDKNGENKEK